MKKITTTTIILSLLLTACTGSKQTPPIETYSFSPTITQQTSSASKANVLRMIPASISPQFSNYSFIYRTSKTQYLVDPYRQFLTAPNIEITTYLENDLAPSLNATLVSTDNLTPANYILQANITGLYADYQNKSAPEAVISIQFVLYHCDHGVTKQIGTILLNEKTSIKPNDAASLMEGYQSDLDKMTEKLSAFVNKQLI